MRVLVACEMSGIVRDEFSRIGWDAWSCDLVPSERPGNHVLGDVRNLLADGWDVMIAHPDCTYLAGSAAWAFKDADYDRYPGFGYHQKLKPGTLTGAKRRAARVEALAFVRLLLECPIPHVCIENPTGFISSMLRKPDQTIQPYQFGDDASKATGLWLKGLPVLRPTRYVEPRMVHGKPRWANQTDGGQNRLSPSSTRATDRARTYPGIAEAMADQWGNL